jgi:DDE superfamily endonuclease
MPNPALRSLRALWEETFRFGLTRPGFANFIVIVSGWILTQGMHAVTEALVMTDVAVRRHHEAYHRFFSRGTWSPDLLGRLLFERIERGLGDGVVRIVIDDTVAPKKGAHVFGLGSHIDPVRSTKRQKIFTFGHCWVVLAVLVRVPFSARTWALPILFRLYRNEKECAKHGAPYKKKTELARELLDVFCAWERDRRIELSADSAYCNDTVTRDLHARVVMFGAMRPDAVLTEPPPASSHSSKGGRPRRRGKLLRKPEQVARDGRTPWQSTEVTLYGKTTTVQFKTFCAQWYRATGTRLLRIVIVATESGAIPYRVFFSFDATRHARSVLETYAGRWGIEVFFREGKQLLGFADSQARKPAAVLRVAPLIGLLYSSLVVWFIEGAHTSPLAAPPVRPWYRHKRGLAFADVLRAARRALDGVDVLVPLSHSENLWKPARMSRRGQKPGLHIAA